MPLTTSLRGLHDIIQAVMLFENYHLFQFNVGDKRYSIPELEWDSERPTLDAKNIKLCALVERGIVQFAYVYDFGDNWRHTLSVEEVTDANPALEYPRFVEGARRTPPEDVGGISGFKEFVEAMTKPRHRDRKQMIAWYGRLFDPDDIDPAAIHARIGKLARRRTIGKAG